jgi:hypothetical protein
VKADPRVKEELTSTFENWKEYIDEIYSHFMKLIKRAKTVEDVMEAKAKFLMELVFRLPIGYEACYFCIAVDGYCPKCEYGKIHGACFNNDSDYAKIVMAKSELFKALTNYYRGETYEEE